MKCNNNSIVILLLMFFFIDGINIKAVCQVKTIVYDFKKGFSEVLPFDEQFQVELQNFPDQYKSIQLILKTSEKKHISEKVRGNDTVYFNHLEDSMSLFFTHENLIAPTYLLLNPNNYYLCALRIQEMQDISDDEKEALITTLTDDIELKKQVFEIFANKQFEMLNAIPFNNLIYKKIKSINPAYEIDTASIRKSSENTISNTAIRNVGGKLIAIGNQLQSLYHWFIDSKLDTNTANELKKLFVLNKVSIDRPFAKIDGSADDFITKLEAIKTLPKWITSDSVILKKSFEGDVESIISKVKADKTFFDTWVENVNNLIKISVANTHILLTLATSIPESANTSTSSVYLSQTFGWGYSFKTGNGLLYFCSSLFLRPVNNSVPFSNVPKEDRWKVKWCLNAGLSLSDITTNRNGKISGLGTIFGDKGGLIGIGYRPLPFLKFDLNSLFYYLDNPNPLVNHKTFFASPLIGISVNLNLLKILSGQPNSLTTLQEALKH